MKRRTTGSLMRASNTTAKPNRLDPRCCEQLSGKTVFRVMMPIIAVDFVRDTGGKWHFLEAGPGAAAGTAHEGVFKYVACRLIGEERDLDGDDVGGRL